MSAPESYPNLSNAGKGRPPKGERRRITTQVSPDVAEYLETLGGGPRRIGAAIEKLVQERIAMQRTESAQELLGQSANGMKVGDIVSIAHVQYVISDWEGDTLTLDALPEDEKVKAEFVLIFK